MKTKNKQALPVLACASAFAIWGLNTPLIKLSLDSISVFTLLFVKFSIGALFFLCLARKSWRPIKKKTWLRIIISTLSGYVLSLGVLYRGIELTGGLNASLIYLLAPLVLYFCSIRFLKEKYDSKLLVGVVAGLAGAILIVGAPLFVNGSHFYGNLLGNLLVLFAVFADVAGTILVKPAFAEISVLQMIAIRSTIAATALIPIVLHELPSIMQIELDVSTAAAVGYNIIFGTLLGLYVYHWGLKRISGEQLSPLHYIDPMVGAIGSIIILGETPTTVTMMGIILVICALYFSESHKLKHVRHLAHHR